MDENEYFDFEELDKEINNQINENLDGLNDLKIKRSSISNKQKLSESISQIVWEQFILQIGVEAGQDFIKENNNLKLSLKKADHYLNEKSFVKGELPKHNFDNIDKYQQRYNKWDSLFEDSNHEHLKKNYRKSFDANRIKGNGLNTMDHTIPVKEIIRDEKAAAYMDHCEKVAFANDPNINLKSMDREANASKADKTMTEWLNSERNGQKPEERFNIDREKCEKDDAYARESFKNKKEEAERKANSEGRASLINEAERSIMVTTQAIAVALLAKLTKNEFKEVFKWLKNKNRNFEDLCSHLKTGITDFLKDFKNNIQLSADVGVTALCTQIFGEIVSTIKKALLFLKTGGKTLINVVKYLKDPINKEKDASIMAIDIGKIVTIGLTTVGAIGLGMVITNILNKIPGLAITIPLLGTPASLLGIFFGGLTSGICGAIVLNLIDRKLQNKQLRENTNKQIAINNNVLLLQETQFRKYNDCVNKKVNEVNNNIRHNMIAAVDEMEKEKKSLNEEIESENKDSFDNISKLLNDFE